MNKPGRNDPCYCGSGKKYKQCHLREDQEAERDRRSQADAAHFLRLDIPGFAREERFAADFDRTLPIFWNEFYDASNAGEMSEFEALRFLDWFANDYTLENGSRIVDIYQEEKSDTLQPLQKQLLDSWMSAPPTGAYELTGYEGQVLQLRDFLTGETYEVFEASGKGNVEIGEVILARLLPVFDRMEFSTPAAYLPKDEIEGLKEALETAQAADEIEHPGATTTEFMRRHNQILVHHALAQAIRVGRPPVARLDPHRTDQPIQPQHSHGKEQVHQPRNYGSTQSKLTQTRRKVV